MASEPSTKKPRTTPPPSYDLLYHPSIPGRGEFIRLVFEASGTPYTDVAMSQKNGYSEVQRICMNDGLESQAGSPPVFAPPALRVKEGEDSGEVWVLSQTPNILSFLGPRAGMAGSGEREAAWAQQLALTALDLNNEVHDSHHPIGPALYYEDQKPEALRKAQDLRANRLPKFFSYFSRVLEGNKQNGGGGGKYMVGGKLSYADTTVWQVLDGLMFAFPKEMEVRKGEYGDLLKGFYESVKSEKGIKEYLASDRRMEYSMGVFRHYPELDRQE